MLFYFNFFVSRGRFLVLVSSLLLRWKFRITSHMGRLFEFLRCGVFWDTVWTAVPSFHPDWVSLYFFCFLTQLACYTRDLFFRYWEGRTLGIGVVSKQVGFLLGEFCFQALFEFSRYWPAGFFFFWDSIFWSLDTVACALGVCFGGLFVGGSL